MYFEGVLEGGISLHPDGENGFGFDPIFIPQGFNVTKASLNTKDYQKVYMTHKPIAQLKDFLFTLK